MFILKIIRILRGYAKIAVEGAFCERFLNLAARRKIDFWNVKKTSDTTMVMFISRKDLQRLDELCRDCGCYVQIVEKMGMPAYMFRYRRRKGFYVGIAAFLLIVWFLSNIIWSVELVNADFLDEQTVRSSLKNFGLYPGAMISKIDVNRINIEMMSAYDELSWIGINIRGTKAVVEARERTMMPDMLDAGTPCNIVAKFPGQIKKIKALAGEVVAKEGQAVSAGQLIVSGIVDSKVEGARYIHSNAEVNAITYHKKNASIPMVKKYNIDTGKKTDRYSLKVFNFVINLHFASSIPYNKYDKINIETPIKIFGSQFPVALLREEYHEQKEASYEITLQQSVSEGENECRNYLFTDNPQIKLISEKFTYVLQGGYLNIDAAFECEENIAMQEEITVDLPK